MPNFTHSRDPILKRRQRLEVWIEEADRWAIREYVDIEPWAGPTGPLRLGDPWPTRDGVVEFMAEATVPEGWPLDEAHLELDLGGEARIWITDADKTERTFGLDPNHGRFPVRTRALVIRVEAVARLLYAAPNPDPRLVRARLVWADADVEAFALRLRTIHDAVEALDGHDALAPMLSAAERALAAVEWPSATAAVLGRFRDDRRIHKLWQKPADLDPHPPALTDSQRASVREATAALDADLGRLQAQYPSKGALALIGHSHVDLAWLWPVEETVRKLLRTFSTVDELLRARPDFRFAQSSAWAYEAVEKADPALFGRVREHIAAGRWSVVGGMWVEPDANLPSGESLARQLLYGQRYFRDRFGETSRIAWVPDSFGFTPGLPQLLQNAGVTSLLTAKMSWNETNRFPYDLFWWEGMSGARVLCHTFENMENAYNGNTTPSYAQTVWGHYGAAEIHPESLYTIGHGDGGGGPTPGMVAMSDVVNTLPALPALRFTTADEHFDALAESAAASELPTWVGEWYLELHRGTYTSQGRTKRLHRRAEHALVAAEALASMAHLAGGPPPPSLEAAWKRVLFCQFHDVVTGASIAEVYARTNPELETTIAEAEQVAADALAALGQHAFQQKKEEQQEKGEAPALLVANPTLAARPIRLLLDAPCDGSQQVDEGHLFLSDESVPPLGAVVLQPTPADPRELSVSETHLENSRLRVELAPDGTLASVFDKGAGREVLAGPGNALWAYADRPRNWEAWDVDENYPAFGEQLPPPERVEVVEEGPHRAALRLMTRFRDSTIVQDLRLWAGSARLDIHTRITWHERRVLLRVRFPLNVRTPAAWCETAFGAHARPTHRNTLFEQARFEVAAHRFVMLEEPGYGAAVLNDGRYGHSIEGNTVGISLLRSPAHPDPYADEGEHQFTYSLFPFEGSWHEAGVMREAQDLNRPLDAVPAAVSGEPWRAATLSGVPLALGALKGAEDGDGLVLRAYEPHGARGAIGLQLPGGWAATGALDGLEDPAGPPAEHAGPFEIVTWKLDASANR